ncbi:MAG: hypothetical protein LC650_00590 [Actinobacteria bacterium]|nr:hypothetical protein [Actinomycetota bacterium]
MARFMDEVQQSAGDSFEFWLRQVDRAYSARLGMGMDDLGDAPWHDYYSDDMTPLDAMAHALADWQDDASMLDLDDLGLGGRV